MAKKIHIKVRDTRKDPEGDTKLHKERRVPGYVGKTYTKTHKSKKAADGHARKISKRGGSVTREGNKLTYTF